MGKRGPAPKPTALKVLAGVRADRINTNEPTPGLVDVVPPEWLPAEALAVWDRLAPDLVARKVLTAWDVDTFAQLCSLIVVNSRALADVEANGATVTTLDRVLSDGTKIYRLQRNPAWQIARESAALLVTIGGRFGLNPSDRSQMSIAEPEPSRSAERYLNPEHRDPSRLLS